MIKIIVVVLTLWVVLFSLRIIQIGGLDPTYREEGVQFLEPLRERLSATIEESLPYPQSALLSGILIGTVNKLPFRLNNQLKITSTIHIVVVSGQNLTILAGFVMSLVSFLGRRKTIILTVLVIVFYSLLTGFQIPVVRAAIMALMAYLAQILGKERLGWWVLFVTAAVMLFYNPHWLLNISFQLSFLATFGVVVVAPVFIKYLKVVPKVLKEDIAVTLAVQLLVMPIIAYNFYQISLIGLLVNSLILWSIPIVMVSGFITLGLGLVSSFLGQLAGLIPGILLTYFIYLVEFFAKIPAASLKVGENGLAIWIGYYLILGAIVWGMSKKLKTQKLKFKSTS